MMAARRSLKRQLRRRQRRGEGEAVQRRRQIPGWPAEDQRHERRLRPAGHRRQRRAGDRPGPRPVTATRRSRIEKPRGNDARGFSRASLQKATRRRPARRDGIGWLERSSAGEPIENPRLYQRARKRLKKAQRRLSRRVKGSHRRQKARVLLAKAHLKVKRARLDFCHKTALDLVRQYDVIYVEKLNIRGMVRNHPLAKAISDAGWGLFLSVLRAKAASAGRVVVEVNPASTSQTCSGCGVLVPKALKDRWHSCPYCDLSLYRDQNAAIRVLQVGEGIAVGR
jgi:IS605 OrfB family transposase